MAKPQEQADAKQDEKPQEQAEKVGKAPAIVFVHNTTSDHRITIAHGFSALDSITSIAPGEAKALPEPVAKSFLRLYPGECVQVSADAATSIHAAKADAIAHENDAPLTQRDGETLDQFAARAKAEAEAAKAAE